jgi:hypothetical protein
MSLSSVSTSPILWLRSPSASERSEIVLTWSCISLIVWPVWSAAEVAACAFSAIEAAVALSSSIVVATSLIAAACSVVAAAVSLAEERRSASALPSVPAVRLTPSSSRPSSRTA